MCAQILLKDAANGGKLFRRDGGDIAKYEVGLAWTENRGDLIGKRSCRLIPWSDNGS